jgi:hypothetical protein
MTRPDIRITPSRAKPFAVDCRELRWWSIVPEVGFRGATAWYDPPDWNLTSVQETHALRTACVHEVDCVEIEVVERQVSASPTRGPAEWLMYGRLTEQKAQWLATLRLTEDRRVLYTFLDDGFDVDWGEDVRRIEDCGCYVRQADGEFALRKRRHPSSVAPIGAGVFRVRIGERSFTCLRVLDVGDGPDEGGMLVEAYLDRSGRTVLFRRHNGRLWAVGGGGGYDGPPWDERFPDHQRTVIDGATYVYWYDHLSDVAVGLEP